MTSRSLSRVGWGTLLRAQVQSKASDAGLYKCPYLGTGMAQISLRIFAI